jgi:hypothetical protein
LNNSSLYFFGGIEKEKLNREHPSSHMSDNEQPAHRRALAKALTSYGYKYDACIEELFISNDDLTVAAAALVKRFGNPSEKMRPTVS